MYTAQLIHTEETIIYKKDGLVISEPKSSEDKLLHSIFGETIVLKSETIEERWTLRNKKEADKRYWDFINENNLDFRNYYLVFDKR